jgi:short-subunit dehydrogenase
MKRNDFKDKVALVTGSSQGIGKATAIELCKRGATVILNGRTASKLRKAELELLNSGYKVRGIQADITSLDDCKRMIDETIQTFGRLDILINNGSLTMNESFEELNPDLFSKIHNSNSIGAVYPTKFALPFLKKTKGSVVFISSLAGLHSMPSASGYSMGKMALTALWQSLRIELNTTGIHFGICYVSFTENESSKRMIKADGTLIPVPKRPSFMLQSRQKVSRKIVGMVKYRRSKVTLSLLGKVIAFLFRHFPTIVLKLIIFSQRKSQTTSAV